MLGNRPNKSNRLLVGWRTSIPKKADFDQNNISYVEHNVELPEIFDLLMTRNPNARTMPQIFIDDELIGGYTDLMERLKNKD